MNDYSSSENTMVMDDSDELSVDNALLGLTALEGLLVPEKEDLTDSAVDAANDVAGDEISEWINTGKLFTELLVHVVSLEAAEREISVEDYLNGLRTRILQAEADETLFERY